MRLRSQAVSYLLLGFVVLFAVFPLSWTILSSFKANNELLGGTITILPTRPSLVQYEELFSKTPFVGDLINSVAVAIGTAVISAVIAVLGAYALARFKIRIRRTIASFTMVLYLIPPITLLVPLFVVFRQLRMLDSLLSLVVAHITYTLPFALWMLWLFMRSIPTYFDDAATVDGASKLQILWHVILPLIRPAVIAVIIFSFMASWNDFLYAFTIINSSNNWTVVLFLNSYGSSETVQWGILMAANTLVGGVPMITLGYIYTYLLQGFGSYATRD